MRSSERTECIKSLIKLKQQEAVIEKTLDNFLENSKLETEILRSLRNEERSYASDRKKLESSLKIAVETITIDLKEIKSVLNSMNEGRKVDTDSFKSKLLELTEKIREYKKDSLLEKLSNEEIELDRDLHSFFLALHKYEMRNCRTNLSIAPRESKKNKNSSSMDHQDFSDLRDFDALVAKTGHTQGWSQEDHLFFLKIRKTTHSVPAMVAAIRKKCPDLTSERIINHEAWYKIYLDLREKQRKTIKEWREKKDMEKRSKIDRAKVESNCPISNEKVQNDEILTKEAETNDSAPKSNEKSTTTKAPSKCNKKEIIDRWRVDKENARYLEAEQKRMAIKSQEVCNERRRLARAKQIKSAVEAYRKNKVESRSSNSTTSVNDLDRVTPKIEATKLFKSFRHQDEEFLSRRRALLQSKNAISSAPVRKRVDNNPNQKSTLLKPTRVWLEKCKGEETYECPNQKILYVKHIPKLASCNWKNRESTSCCN